MIEQKILFNKSECQSILDLTGDWVINDKYKKSDFNEPTYDRINEECYIDSYSIKSLMLNKLKEFSIIDIPDNFKILKYNTGGKFGLHKDSGWNYPSRKKTLIIHLSNQSDYSGGNMFVGDTIFHNTLGSCIVFDSNEYHELTEVTSGTRFVAVMWLDSNHLLNTSII